MKTDGKNVKWKSKEQRRKRKSTDSMDISDFISSGASWIWRNGISCMETVQ